MIKLVICGQRSGCEELTVVVVVAYDYLFYQAVLAQLAPNVFVESVKVHLHLLRAHLVLWVVCWVLVHVREKDGLRVRRLNVFSRAAVAMAAGANLVVKTAIDLRVELLAEDAITRRRAVVPCPAQYQRWRRDNWPYCQYIVSRIL